MDKVKKSIKRFNVAIGLLVLCDLLIAHYIHSFSGSAWGWRHYSYDDNKVLAFEHWMAILQFVVFAVTLDSVLQRSCILFNLHSKSSRLPRILVQFFRFLVYAFSALAGFILLYDHSIPTLIAASGAIGLAVAYSAKDLLTDYFASIEIQFDNRVSIGDWIEISEDGGATIYKVLDMDHRMVSMMDVDGYVVLIPNTQFIVARLVNLTRQNRGCRRRIELQIDSKYATDRIKELILMGIRHAHKTKEGIDAFGDCLVGGLVDGSILYVIKYDCRPHLSQDASHSLILDSVFRFLCSASINLESYLCIEKESKFDTVMAQRLSALQMFGILKVLSSEELNSLAARCEFRQFQKGQKVVALGEIGASMFLIADGMLEVRVPDHSGNLVPVSTLWAGDCMGEMSLLTGAPRSADVIALNDVLLIEIRKDDLDPILRNNEKLVEAFSEILSERAQRNLAVTQASSPEDVQMNLRAKIAGQINSFFGFVRKMV